MVLKTEEGFGYDTKPIDVSLHGVLRSGHDDTRRALLRDLA